MYSHELVGMHVPHQGMQAALADEQLTDSQAVGQQGRAHLQLQGFFTLLLALALGHDAEVHHGPVQAGKHLGRQCTQLDVAHTARLCKPASWTQASDASRYNPLTGGSGWAQEVPGLPSMPARCTGAHSRVPAGSRQADRKERCSVRRVSRGRQHCVYVWARKGFVGSLPVAYRVDNRLGG